MYPEDGDTLSVCRGELIILEATVSNEGNPVTNATYYWDFDNGLDPTFGVDLDSVSITYGTASQILEPYKGGGGYRIKLSVIDESMQEGFIIIPVKVAIPPNFSETKVDLPEDQTGICLGSTVPLIGKAYTEFWEDEAFSYTTIEDTDGELFMFDDVYSSGIGFDEFEFDMEFNSGDLDSLGFTIVHSNMGDLKIALECDNGDTVLIKDFDPGNSSDLGEVDNSVGYAYYWSEVTGTETMNSQTTEIISPGVYLPEESFDNFAGCSMNGDWTVIIEDNQDNDENGRVFSWSIHFNEQVLPAVWTFRDTLVEYKIINSIPVGTFWSGTNVTPFQVEISEDSVLHNANCTPEDDGNSPYIFYVVTNWGCVDSTSVTVRVEDVSISVDKESVLAVVDSVEFSNETSWGVSWDWEFGDEESALDTISPVYHIYEKGNETYTAILTVYDENGCFDTDTVEIEVNIEPAKILGIPTAFSPSRFDQSLPVNNIWYFDEDNLQGIYDFKLTIYDRWGKKVFEADKPEDVIEPNGWDGTMFNRGIRHCPPGPYYYVITARDKQFGEKLKAGRGGTNQNQDDVPQNFEGDLSKLKGVIYLFRTKTNTEEEP